MLTPAPECWDSSSRLKPCSLNPVKINSILGDIMSLHLRIGRVPRHLFLRSLVACYLMSPMGRHPVDVKGHMLRDLEIVSLVLC